MKPFDVLTLQSVQYYFESKLQVASTNWKKLMMILSDKTSVKDPEDPRIGNPHHLGALNVLHDYNDKVS